MKITTTDLEQQHEPFDRAGPANAPAILLVHGSVVTRKMWLPQLRGLSSAYQVIAPDLPGHGVLAGIPFTFSVAAQTFEDIIRRQANGRALVAGLSLGGYVAMELARQCPELVAGLVLSGCSLNFEGVLASYLKLVSWLMRRGWLKLSKEQAEQRVKRMFPPELADVAEALGPSYAELAGRDFAAVLGGYSGPSLILNGKKDTSSRRGESKFVSAARQGRTQHITGAGHACNLDQPEKYNLAVREFAQSIGWVSSQAG
jgi:pimeloyl-ACP methyl ester carboxylesterase